MKIFNEDSFINKKDKMIQEIISGKIFIYPTDTIYGIGCNALIGESIKRIREIKKRDEKPFSVIAPSKDWIRKKCFVNEKIESWISKLPGAYTLILELKEKGCVAKDANSNENSLGVRIPNNWFTEIISKTKLPFVTTSVNLAGEKPSFSIDEIDSSIKNKVDYIINVGRLEGKPSTIVNLLNGKEEIRER